MISLYTDISDVQSIVSTTNTTSEGILLGCVLVLIVTVAYLFKYTQKLNAEREVFYKEHTAEMKTVNEMIVRINNQYAEAIHHLAQFNKK